MELPKNLFGLNNKYSWGKDLRPLKYVILTERNWGSRFPEKDKEAKENFKELKAYMRFHAVTMHIKKNKHLLSTYIQRCTVKAKSLPYYSGRVYGNEIIFLNLQKLISDTSACSS